MTTKAKREAEDTQSRKKDKSKTGRKYTLIIIVVIVAIGYPILRSYIGGAKCQSTARLEGKTVVVTGANTGIGLETARDLAARGARVVMACRNHERCQDAADDIFKTTGNKPVIKIIDLSDLDSVRSFAKEINQEESRLDVLINNAGIMMCPKLLSKQGYELQFATNHLGHFLLTNLLLDLLKKSAPSRIVVVSSKAYKRGKQAINFDDINHDKSYSRFDAYGHSKLANVLFSNELARRLEGTGVVVNSLHPGVIRTELVRHIQDMLPSLLKTLLLPLYEGFVYAFLKNPVEGAQTQICLAVSEDFKDVTGKYFSDCEEEELLPLARNKEAESRLWRLSEEMTELATA